MRTFYFGSVPLIMAPPPLEHVFFKGEGGGGHCAKFGYSLEVAKKGGDLTCHFDNYPIISRLKQGGATCEEEGELNMKSTVFVDICEVL